MAADDQPTSPRPRPKKIGAVRAGVSPEHWHSQRHASDNRSAPALQLRGFLRYFSQYRGGGFVGAGRRCGSDVGFGCRLRFCPCGGVDADRQFMGGSFGDALFDADCDTIRLVSRLASFPAGADRGDQGRLRCISRAFSCMCKLDEIHRLTPLGPDSPAFVWIRLSGARNSALNPGGLYDFFTSFVPTIPSSISRVPKPFRFGSNTGGPPYSIHFRASTAPSCDQITSMTPSPALNAPYFTAFVASS